MHVQASSSKLVMAKRQAILRSAWSIPTKKVREEGESDQEREGDWTVNCGDSLTQPQNGESNDEAETVVDSVPTSSACTAPYAYSTICCACSETVFQRIDKLTLSNLIANFKKRNFQPQWYKQFPWLSVCISSKKVYCLYCRHASQHNLITFSKMGEKALTETGFHNWRKAVEKFKSHEGSHVHREAKIKWMARRKPSNEEQMSFQIAQLQLTRRQGLLTQ